MSVGSFASVGAKIDVEDFDGEPGVNNSTLHVVAHPDLP